ncbi:unnamed protein product, partial [Onchocerca ochengi]|uniref:Bacteriophage protein n=1 Tax=Onchocerca ochengi TaxID=42157 RepID=A0A182EXI5_ONCOC
MIKNDCDTAEWLLIRQAQSEGIIGLDYMRTLSIESDNGTVK